MERFSYPLPEIGHLVIPAPLGAVKTILGTGKPWRARPKRIQREQKIVITRVKFLITVEGIQFQKTGIGSDCEIDINLIHKNALLLDLCGIETSQHFFVGPVNIIDIALTA